MRPAAGGTVNLVVYAAGGAHDGARYAETNTSYDEGSVYQDVGVDLKAGESASFSIWARLGPGVAAAGQQATCACGR